MPTRDAELQHWLDVAAITDLIHRYSDAVTRADWDQAQPLFAPDAVWESPLLGMRFEGARAFLDYLAESSSALDLLIQSPSAPVVRSDGSDRAEATTTIHELILGTSLVDSERLGPAGSAMNHDQWGIYHDELARFEDGWRFTHRTFVPLLVAPGSLIGQTVARRNSLAAVRGPRE